ncbi:dinuclear metal center protein, YbgI/SA1388 family [Desulfosporosinus acidiphilus SJ4]|uniref:GTP cyclohydrolase 1 type 2 homolog n=1 Tax=Desulfosporosinus acidiphilus (strain DSM 22704 / JCM 16185 / SJ4) TaxID=646529 RepID=I4DAC6_DESAJ|nr:Nif3-like dinuclear metal center hexameric protein [Desulfosporosinus acidiphilus]AFM42750.1 dinuclear metal center protein, YbgI/SA1388 family [Desulfosporosinus acidiphilus SJ4]
MAVTIGQVAQLIEKLAPKFWAEEWDNVGLLVGSGSAQVERILIALDGTLEVVEEAREFGAQLIIAHHPIMFRPLKNLRSDNAAAKIPLLLLNHQIGYYAVHTNLDQSRLSSSFTLGEILDLKEIKLLEEKVSEGTKNLQSNIIPSNLPDEARGYGVIGYLERPEKLEIVWQNFLERLKKSNIYAHPYDLTGVRLAGSLQKEIRKVAIVNGSGGRFVPKALFKGVDLLITGDVDHHAVLDALEGGMAVGDLGHFLSEAPMLQALNYYLSSERALQRVEFKVSKSNSSPWR